MHIKKIMGLVCVMLLGVFLCTAVAQDEIVNLNTATAEQLKAIEDIDFPENLAEEIVKYREANGPFKNPEDLSNVPGMTQDFLEELNPVKIGKDVVYDPDAEPALAPSKC